MAIALGLLLSVWIVLMFARQVSEAAAASSRADVLVISNDEQAARVAALSRELQQIQRQRYIDQQARAYGLGRTREIAFSLDPNAPPLPGRCAGFGLGPARHRLRRRHAARPLADPAVRVRRLT